MKALGKLSGTVAQANAIQAVKQSSATVVDNRPAMARQLKMKASVAGSNLRLVNQYKLAGQGANYVAAQLVKDSKLVVAHGGKYKKKQKERDQEEKVQQTLDQQIETWTHEYGHSVDRHVNMTNAALDNRNIPLATTFETEADLAKAAKHLIMANEAKLNSWYKNEDTERIVIWAYLPDECQVRGRRRPDRPEWHQYLNPMPPRPGFTNTDPGELPYVIGVFDRDNWANKPKGLVTCFPADEKPN
ncbi:MAG: hypothetical protein ACRYG7_50145 [Janthinobacterium lividum]